MCFAKSFKESLLLSCVQITVAEHCFAHSAISAVLPYPAGASTRVAPGLFSVNNVNKCLRVMKLFGREGGNVRDRVTPSIIGGDEFCVRVAIPKGDTKYAKSQGNPHQKG